jgi:hypothetical protein
MAAGSRPDDDIEKSMAHSQSSSRSLVVTDKTELPMVSHPVAYIPRYVPSPFHPEDGRSTCSET